MATFDAASVAKSGTATSLSWSHTTSADADRIMLVGCFAAAGVIGSISSVTYNGVGATERYDAQYETFHLHGLYTLVDPDSGSNTVVITWSASQDQQGGVAMTFYGRNTTTPFADVTAATGATTGPATVTVPNVVSGDIVVDFATSYSYGAGNSAATVGANQTSRAADISSPAFVVYMGSTQAGADGGVMSWTLDTDTSTWGIIGVRLPAAAAGAEWQGFMGVVTGAAA